MKDIILFFFLVLLFTTGRAQSDVWTAYWNADTTLYGFKNNSGQVTIEPRFSGAGVARKLEHIMSVIEESPATGKWSAYFLTRTGKKQVSTVFIFLIMRLIVKVRDLSGSKIVSWIR
ncbi:hypothetical protein [Niabella hibiscisoli]|uniref:hypothetical protein n=1 Tax=Niabella hibiscisoli TaxID=1825928 RepID=UPI001F0FEE0C|nr:hypothetical protein [Niabella hibiscisoli]MCH5716842.1 hypothetical protein [Niabella hibiscisoli]